MKKKQTLRKAAAMSVSGLLCLTPVLPVYAADDQNCFTDTASSFADFSQDSSDSVSNSLSESESEMTPEADADEQNTADDADMDEAWSVERADWSGDRLDLRFTYSTKHPVFAAILPLSCDAALCEDVPASVMDGETKLADIVCEAGQLGLLFTDEGLAYLEAGNTITAGTAIEFDQPDSVHCVTVGEEILSSDKTWTEEHESAWVEESLDGQDESQDAEDEDESDPTLSIVTNSLFNPEEAGNPALEPSILYGSLDSKIQTLKAMFPAHSFWNHPASQTAYNPESVSNTSSDSPAYEGNMFDGTGKCNGFSYLCYFKTHGVRIRSNGTRHVNGNEGVRVGDVIHTKHKWDHPVLGHYSYVWKIEGDTYYKLEGNFKGNDEIWHTNTVQKSDIVDYFTPADSGDYDVYACTNLSHVTDLRHQYSSTTGLSAPDHLKSIPKFHTLRGWEVINLDNWSRLYTDGKGNFRWYNSAQAAQYAGLPSQVLLKDGQKIGAIFKPGQTLLLVAQWDRLPYTVNIDAAGGTSEIKTISTYIGEPFRLPDSFEMVRPGKWLKGYIPYASNGQRLYAKGDETMKPFASDESAKNAGYSPVVFDEGSQVDAILTEKSGDTVTLRAQWEDKEYYVQYIQTEYAKLPVFMSGTFKFGDTVQIPEEEFDRKGYAFAGWRVLTSSQILCEKKADGKVVDRRLFRSEGDAANAGYTPVLVPNGGSFVLSYSQGKTGNVMELQTRWKNTQTEKVTMHRLYNPNSGEHFYTSSTHEKDYLVKLGWKSEGTGWIAPKKSSIPVYRLYNPNAGDHHYTLNGHERDALIKAGWKDEGIGWYSDEEETVPVYRQYNPNAKAGSHNYTSSLHEHTGLMSLKWNGEGVGWYGCSEK